MRWKYKNDSASDKQNTQSIPFSVKVCSDDDTNNLESLQSPIKTVNNKIYFYCDVETYTILELNRTLREMDYKIQNMKTIFGDNFTPTIDLHLNTNGGTIYDALATVDTIRNLKSAVNTYIDGGVASAGTLISAIGNRRYMGEHAHLLIHQLSAEMYGKFTELEDTFNNCDKLMKMLKEFYKKHTKIPMKKLDELVKHDLWMNAQECLDYGIIDEII